MIIPNRNSWQLKGRSYKSTQLTCMGILHIRTQSKTSGWEEATKVQSKETPRPVPGMKQEPCINSCTCEEPADSDLDRRVYGPVSELGSKWLTDAE
eukprot:2123841-Ditylum_brightwellii.AAC.2